MASQINKNIHLTDEENTSLESLKQIRTILYSGTQDEGKQETIQLSDDSYNYTYLEILCSDLASCKHISICYPGMWYDLTTSNWLSDSGWFYISTRTVYTDHLKLTSGHNHTIWFRPNVTEQISIRNDSPMSIISVIGVK